MGGYVLSIQIERKKMAPVLKAIIYLLNRVLKIYVFIEPKLIIKKCTKLKIAQRLMYNTLHISFMSN